MDVVVLNADYSFLNTIHWKRAIVLVDRDKVDVVKYADKYVRTCDFAYKLPLVVKLREFVQILYHRSVKLTKRNIFLRDEFLCAYCGKDLHNSRSITVDHVLPKSLGGKNSWENCVTACKKCNYSKGNRTPEQAGLTLRVNPQKLSVKRYVQLSLKHNKKYQGVKKLLDFLQ